MTEIIGYSVNPGWRILLNDVGIRSEDVLRRTGLPGDLFGRDRAILSTPEYFRMWECIEEEADDPAISLKIGSAISVEAFDPPIFAAMCSPDLNTALKRLAKYKRLIAPMRLDIRESASSTRLVLKWLDTTIDPPAPLVLAELVFFVQLCRLSTRHDVKPLKVISPVRPVEEDAYGDWFGVPVTRGEQPTLEFDIFDATRPFLTANEKMWEFFEPNLRKRLVELDASASTSERVRTALLELIPVGTVSLDHVAKKLGASTRTLQRRLNVEGNSFQTVLNDTRADLAKNYLKQSHISGKEISFLLGFEDPSSFFRAYHSWTGETPEQARRAYQQVS